MNGWKILAILLLVVLVVENVGLYLMLDWAFGDIAKESECNINICGSYESYGYSDGVCTCYNGFEAQHTEYIS